MYARLNPAAPESLYDAIVRWAGAASPHLLRVLAWSGWLGAIGVMAIDAAQWPVGVGMIAIGALGAWGLLEHRLSGRQGRGIETLERVVATLALVAALIAILVGLFVFLGPAPHF
jgi:hypothetical protein